MKFISTAGWLLLFCLQSHAQNNDLQSQRLQVAIGWLDNLCVVSNGDFLLPSQSDLLLAFHKWIGDANTPVCASANDPSNKQQAQIKADITSLQLGRWERVARMGQLQINIQQNPDYVYGIREGETSTPPKIGSAHV